MREHNQPDSIDTTPAATGTPQSEGPHVTQPATTQELIADVLLHHMNDDDAYTAADAILRDPALTIRPRRIITGEWRDVRDALDKLPEGTAIRWFGEYKTRPNVAVRVGKTWEMNGYQRPLKSETIARDNTPIEVIA